MTEQGRRVAVYRRLTAEMTNLEFDLIYSVCKGGRVLLSVPEGGFILLNRRRVNYGFDGLKRTLSQ